MKRLLFFVFTVLLIFSFGCEKEGKDTIANIVFGTEVDESKREYIYDEAIGRFIEDVHNVNNLKEYKVYRNEDEMNIDLYFNENAERSDIMGSKDGVVELFVWQRGLAIAGPYPETLYSQEIWYKVNHRVFIGNRKILEQNIYKNKITINKVEYYEDTENELPIRIVENDEMKELRKKIKRKFWWSVKDVVIEKSFKGNVIFIKVKGRNELDSNKIAVIEGFIEGEFADKVSKSSVDKYKLNMDYRGFVLMLYAGDKKYYERTYQNGDIEKYWFDEYWGNHEYYDFNN